PRRLAAVDMPKTESLIMEAVNKGINYFDTAYMYPGCEEALGTILEKHKVRELLFIATKLPLLLLKSPEDFEVFFQKQLERLRTTYIDYYLLHMLTDMDLWEKLKAWGIETWIQEKKQSGAVKQIGFSFHGSQAEFFKLLEAYPWEFCQIQYNYAGEHFQAGTAGLLKAAERMPVIAMEPLLGGKLATGLPAKAADLFRRADPELSPAGWGLKWVWDHPEVTLLLSGMNDKRQLEENLRIADTAFPKQLTETQHETYRNVLNVFNASYKVRCTGCNYCMPCPQNVNIPGCFAGYNASFAIGFVSGMQQYITSTALTSSRTANAARCVKCGRCEQHCPQHLPIIKHLESVRKRMEPFWMKWVVSVIKKFMSGQ
ncbi:MAG: aldo/keto reductase, partial [Spirochaetaceae bacterium]|nr:aldo/keto reductase [Spirochaetaceae bacterium]